MLAVSIGADFKLVSVLVCRNKIKLSDKAWVAEVILRFTVAIEAPLHRHRFDLSDDFHFVDSAVAGNTTDPAVDVSGVIEVNKVRKVVNSFP